MHKSFFLKLSLVLLLSSQISVGGIIGGLSPVRPIAPATLHLHNTLHLPLRNRDLSHRQQLTLLQQSQRTYSVGLEVLVGNERPGRFHAQRRLIQAWQTLPLSQLATFLQENPELSDQESLATIVLAFRPYRQTYALDTLTMQPLEGIYTSGIIRRMLLLLGLKQLGRDAQWNEALMAQRIEQLINKNQEQALLMEFLVECYDLETLYWKKIFSQAEWNCVIQAIQRAFSHLVTNVEQFSLELLPSEAQEELLFQGLAIEEPRILNRMHLLIGSKIRTDSDFWEFASDLLFDKADYALLAYLLHQDMIDPQLAKELALNYKQDESLHHWLDNSHLLLKED